MNVDGTGKDDRDGRTRLRDFARPGVIGSLLLHAAVLVLLLYQIGAPPDEVAVIPVEMVPLVEELASVAQQPGAPAAPGANSSTRLASVTPPRTPVPRPRAAPTPVPPAAPSSAEQPAPDVLPPAPVDPLQSQLEALAKLRVQNSGRSGPPSALGAGNNPGYRVEDLVRAQVLRRWNLRLDELGEGELSIRIHVVLEADGTVTTAEILDTETAKRDAGYRSIALSARNAVLLSSPFTLPAGMTAEMRDMTLTLNTRDTLR
jgi:hypothetical protein